MVAKQLSIFGEQVRPLTEATEVLAKKVSTFLLYVLQRMRSGILRGIVSEPDKAYKALKIITSQ